MTFEQPLQDLQKTLPRILGGPSDNLLRTLQRTLGGSSEDPKKYLQRTLQRTLGGPSKDLWRTSKDLRRTFRPWPFLAVSANFGNL